jgi:hypothetical protein
MILETLIGALIPFGIDGIKQAFINTFKDLLLGLI